MLFFIHHKGKEHRVRVESRRGQLMVAFEGGEEIPVDISYFGNDVTFLDQSRVFHANVVGDKGDYTVWRPEGNLHLAVESEYRRIVGLLRGQDVTFSGNVYAKMPGKITKLHVKVGDKLEKGSPVLVMEAMKMENDVRSTVVGEVTRLCVSEGQAVETGFCMVEVKEETED